MSTSGFPLWRVVLVSLVALLLVWQIWDWEVERVEVPPGKFLVRVHRWGKDLPEGELIAPDESYKGVMLDVLKPARYFINPLFWSYEMCDQLDVGANQRLVRIRQFGKDIPDERLKIGDILAREPDERGVEPGVKEPGRYFVNPYAYKTHLVDGVQIRVDQVGVRTLKVGKDPSTLKEEHTYTVPAGYRGVQQDYVPAGIWYPNPYEEMIAPVDIRSHLVTLEDIKFPSRDGFILKPKVIVEYAVEPAKAPELVVRLSDNGKLNQEDATLQEQSNNEILQKVILPHVRGYVRVEGSNFDARAFILTATDADTKEPAAGKDVKPAKDAKPAPRVENARELLQKRMFVKLKEDCARFGIIVRSATIAEMIPPPELAKQINERELARVEQARNRAQLSQYKTAEQLKAAMALKKQATDKVQAETRLVQATTQAQQAVEVAESRLKQELANAQIQLDASRKLSEAALLKGKTEADVIGLQNEAEVSGLRKSIQGFATVQNFAQYNVISRIAPALTEVFSSDDGDFAKIFAGLMKTAPEKPHDRTATAKDK